MDLKFGVRLQKFFQSTKKIFFEVEKLQKFFMRLQKKSIFCRFYVFFSKMSSTRHIGDVESNNLWCLES